jgi:hypothetical protein
MQICSVQIASDYFLYSRFVYISADYVKNMRLSGQIGDVLQFEVTNLE